MVSDMFQQSLGNILNVLNNYKYNPDQNDKCNQIDLKDKPEQKAPGHEEYLNFNFTLKKIEERKLVNSWNIKDTIGYKLDLQANLDPDFWQWL